MEDNKEKETEGTPTELTIEEQFEALKTEKAVLETQLEEKTKGLKTAHTKLTQKDEELKRRGEVEGKIASLEDQFKFFIGYQAETQGRTGEEFEEAKKTRGPDLMKRFETMTKESERKRQVETQKQEAMARITSIKERVDALGLPEDSEDYNAIEDWATRGKYDRVESRLKRLESEKEKEVIKESPQETEEVMKARLEREILVKHGLLKPEGAKPSSGGSNMRSREELRKSFVAGDIKIEEYERRLAEI